MTWTVVVHPLAEHELLAVPTNERAALDNCIKKLAQIGPQLPFPHTSAIQGSDGIRELRPRAGRSPWRAFYRQIGNVLVIAAIGPEAQVNRRKFDRAIQTAEERLNELEDDQ